MIALKTVLLFLCLGARARAEPCPEVYGLIRQEAARLYHEELSCEDVRRVDKKLAIAPISLAEGTWTLAGEAELRERLQEGRGLRIPDGVIPLGGLERASPTGKEVLLVFGREMPRLEGIIHLARGDDFGKGTLYDRVGVFARGADGRYPALGEWFKTEPGGLWGTHQKAPKGVRLCLPCAGWQCPKDPIACFSDFNDDGWEEAHLTSDCREERCVLTMLEGKDGGSARRLFEEAVHEPAWKEGPGGWALVPAPLCEPGELCAGLGNPNCVRPNVYRLARGSHKVVKDEGLREEYYRVSVRRVPADCPFIRRETVVWSKENGFVKYRP